MKLLRKLKFIAFMTMFSAMISANLATAEPMYYTFEGTISEIVKDDGGLIAGAELYVGHPVKYVYEVDFDRQGYRLFKDGTTLEFTDTYVEFPSEHCTDGICEYIRDSFYTKFISGALINHVDYINTSIQELFEGEDEYEERYLGDVHITGELSAGAEHQTIVRSYTALVKDWVLGESVESREYAVNGYLFSYYDSELTLMGISETPPFLVVDIDVQPRNTKNNVNLSAVKPLPVAVLGSVSFDAQRVDLGTVTFGPGEASPVRSAKVKDVNSDGFLDAQFSFEISDTGLQCGDTEATLNAETYDGLSVTGTDSINVRCK